MFIVQDGPHRLREAKEIEFETEEEAIGFLFRHGYCLVRDGLDKEKWYKKHCENYYSETSFNSCPDIKIVHLYG